MNFDELQKKGAELVEQRNKATGAERAMLNKEITAIRAAQITALKEELIKGLSVAIPTLVEQLINDSDVVKQIRELQRGE